MHAYLPVKGLPGPLVDSPNTMWSDTGISAYDSPSPRHREEQVSAPAITRTPLPTLNAAEQEGSSGDNNGGGFQNKAHSRKGRRRKVAVAAMGIIVTAVHIRTAEGGVIGASCS